MEYLGFSWIIEGSLAAAQGPVTRRDLVSLKLRGIEAIIRMEENTITGDAYELLDLYEPVPDFTAPRRDQLDRMVRFIDDQIENWEKPVVVTCHAGLGRTGTVLAGYMVSVGHQPEAAINIIRELRPGSVQTPEQEQAVHQYAEFLRSEQRL